MERAKGTSSSIALEELKDMRKRTTVRKNRRYRHNSWSFYQLRTFIEYKALEAGVPVMGVNPKNTSRECPACHTIDKRNRAAVNQPIVAGAISDLDLIPQLQVPSVRVG